MQVLDYVMSRQLRLTGMGLTIGEIAVQLVSLVTLAYILHLLISLLAEAVIKILHTRSTGFDSQLIRLTFRILFWVLTLMAIAVISEHIGVPVAALAAGIGVGGLAFALAAQSTLENLVAGLTIYGDRPIRVGDFCTIGGVSGTVESIGLRSTRLRTLARTLVTIPNAEVAKHNLENFAVRDRMLLHTTLGLRYETTPDQLRYLLGRLRELFYGHPKVVDDGLRVRFIGFGASSLDIEIYLYVKATAKPAFMEICEDLNLRIMDIVDEAGAGFAFPSQTAYLARDTAPDPDRVRAAETRVEAWRESGELPFPDLADEAQDAVGDKLDYPPIGSPGNKRTNTTS
jgi:MscS family membrane protein